MICGPASENFPPDHPVRVEVLNDAEERFMIFHKMAEKMLTLEEEEERQFWQRKPNRWDKNQHTEASL